MSRFASALFMCVIVTVLARSTGLMPTSAEAASVSKADKIALKEAIVACKAEARGKKVKWLARRKFFNNCVARVLKKHPTMDPLRMTREHPNIKGLPRQKSPAEWGCPSSC